MTASSNNGLPDKGFLYGVYQQSADWREKLHKRLAHKSLDMNLDDEMNVDNSRNQLGITWKEIAAIGALLLGGFYVYNQSQQPQQLAPHPAQVSPADSEYEVRFYDAEGNPIDVKPLERK